MRIKRINEQIRRDFWADYECEHCGFIEKDIPGYDDLNFHQNVIPKMVCPRCGKTADSSYRPRATKYDDSQVV